MLNLENKLNMIIMLNLENKLNVIRILNKYLSTKKKSDFS